MGIPLNDQWILDRAQAAGCVRLASAPDDEQDEPRAPEFRDLEHDWPRPHLPRVRGKRVRYIDRDT